MKRDGKVVDFEDTKITEAIRKSLMAVRDAKADGAESLSLEVIKMLEKRFPKQIPGVEDIQDIVEEVLMKYGYSDVARAYILYRQKRAEIRRVKDLMGVRDELKLSVNAANILKRRYLQKNKDGGLESPSQMFRRVAEQIASIDRFSDNQTDVNKIIERFYTSMINLDFLPHSCILMNVGTQTGQLSSCFAIPIQDSMESIFDALRDMSLILGSGGGTGLSISNLRPKGDIVKSTKGVASGPVSFLSVFDMSTEVVKQRDRNRRSNMSILGIDHPDIIEFVTAKTKKGFLRNFDLSVAITDDFMKTVQKDGEYETKNPRTNIPTQKLRAADLFDLIVTMAWRTGDPGLLFIDRMNASNTTPHIGEFEGTGPCREQPLLAYETCMLGSINISNMVIDGKIDFDKLKTTVHTAVHFLDNAIDASKYPLPKIEEITKRNRKIGLGVMGFAEFLIKLSIPYNSKEAVQTAERLMRYISREARKISSKLGEKRGSFPNFKGSLWEQKGYNAMRNATTTTIASTGTLSVIAGCSNSIEPLFAIAYIRKVMEETKLLEVNSLFEEEARRKEFYNDEIITKIARTGSIKDFKEITADTKRLFVTSFDIKPEWHIRIQAAFQKYIDNATSKSVLLPYDATVDDVRNVFLLAYRLGCKVITVYRYGSKREDLLNIGSISVEKIGENDEYVSADIEYSGGSPTSLCIGE
jgi:ribonucleoside-diphosphate reductase alpha chain